MGWYSIKKKNVGIFFRVLRKGLLYTIIVVLMCALFIAYPALQDWLYRDYLRPKINVSLYGDVMALIPLVWISLIGLVVSWFNTVFYCVFDADGPQKWWNKLLAVVAIAIVGCIVFICTQGYTDIKHLILNDYQGNDFLLEIFKLYKSFSFRVSILTIVTFAVYAFIDFFDARHSRKSMKLITTNKEIELLNFKSSRLQFWLIDITVLLSSIILLWFSSKIDDSQLPKELVRGDLYKNIFMAGGWGIQIIYSQFVFYFLTMRYYFELEKIEQRKKDGELTAMNLYYLSSYLGI